MGQAGRGDGTRFMALLLSHDDWFRSLSRGEHDPDQAAWFMDDQLVGGAAVRVVELTGRPGDLVLTHPRAIVTAESAWGGVP